MVTLADFSGVTIYDDGLHLFNMSGANTVISKTITYSSSAQNTFLSRGIEDINTGLADQTLSRRSRPSAPSRNRARAPIRRS